MKTEKRIQKLKETVMIIQPILNKKLVVADIGTDHGYLAEALSKDENVEKIIATDISEKSLLKVKKLIKDNHLSKIETVVGDGLMPIESVDISVIAGVGGWEIIKILKYQNKTKLGLKCRYFLLQPAQNIVEVRRWIFSNHYRVLKDFIVEDAGGFFPVVLVDLNRFQINLKTQFNLFFGRDNTLDSKDFILFLKDNYESLKFLDKIEKQKIKKDKKLRQKLKRKIFIEKLLKKC